VTDSTKITFTRQTGHARHSHSAQARVFQVEVTTLGTRGYRPAAETLDRIDTHLLWEPGSAMAALKGGVPISRGPVFSPHPALVPLSAIKDRLKVMKARAQRQRQALEQMECDIDDALAHLDLVVADIGDPRRRLTGRTGSAEYPSSRSVS
jgi:hypothetical protein